MVKKKGPDAEGDTSLSRREFFKKGAAAGVGAAAAVAVGTGAAEASPADSIKWDYEVDIVILGGGCVGIHSGIRAHDLGASVLVLEQNFDLGGRMIHSSGQVSLGGGDALQERDRLGLDPQEMGLAAPLVSPEELDDDPDRLFADMTDWSVVDEAAVAPYRMNDREMQRAHADHAPIVRQFMFDNYVKFPRIGSTHSGGGMSRARAAFAVLKLGDVTDIKAGTISREDLGSAEEERSSPFNPRNLVPDATAALLGAPGWYQGGFTMSRCLEFSAREKGVQFMLNRHMDEIIREMPFSGRVLGVKATYTPKFDPDTGERLESFWQNGNVDERRETIYVRARKAVIVGTGGHHENRAFRSMFDARLSDPSVFGGGDGLMGPRAADASGIIAGMKIGGALAGLQQNYQNWLSEAGLESVLATSARWDSLFPGHPVFKHIKSVGINIGNGGWEHVIAVNQVGQRFYDESAIRRVPSVKWPPGTSGSRDPFVPGDWHNCSVEHIRGSYNRAASADAALAVNEGSKGPNYWSGPVWAIFDAAAAERGGWQLRFPYIADPPDGLFFQADTLGELARKVQRYQYQHTPLKYLEETVARYNAFADAGVDEDFEKPVMHRIDTGPFYAAIIPLLVHESYGGLRINAKAQVVDLSGQVIPGLYAGGEASGGGAQHGIGRASVHGYIAGSNAVHEPTT